MLPSNVRNANANLGFSLIELSLTVVVIGVLAAITVPGFIQMYERFQANSAFDQVRGAIKEAQLQAIRRSTTCTLTIDEANKKITTTNSGCLINAVTLPSSTSITTNGSGKTVSFDFQGNTGILQTIVVSNNSKNYNKCLVISNGIGMMRWGNYDISSTSCTTQ